MDDHEERDASSPELMDETHEGTDPPPKKPGSKAKGRKRTKTGCLSKIATVYLECITNAGGSMSKETHQMR